MILCELVTVFCALFVLVDGGMISYTGYRVQPQVYSMMLPQQYHLPVYQMPMYNQQPHFYPFYYNMNLHLPLYYPTIPQLPRFNHFSYWMWNQHRQSPWWFPFWMLHNNHNGINTFSNRFPWWLLMNHNRHSSHHNSYNQARFAFWLNHHPWWLQYPRYQSLWWWFSRHHNPYWWYMHHGHQWPNHHRPWWWAWLNHQHRNGNSNYHHRSTYSGWYGRGAGWRSSQHHGRGYGYGLSSSYGGRYYSSGYRAQQLGHSFKHNYNHCPKQQTPLLHLDTAHWWRCYGRDPSRCLSQLLHTVAHVLRSSNCRHRVCLGQQSSHEHINYLMFRYRHLMSSFVNRYGSCYSSAFSNRMTIIANIILTRIRHSCYYDVHLINLLSKMTTHQHSILRQCQMGTNVYHWKPQSRLERRIVADLWFMNRGGAAWWVIQRNLAASANKTPASSAYARYGYYGLWRVSGHVASWFKSITYGLGAFKRYGNWYAWRPNYWGSYWWNRPGAKAGNNQVSPRRLIRMMTSNNFKGLYRRPSILGSSKRAIAQMTSRKGAASGKWKGYPVSKKKNVIVNSTPKFPGSTARVVNIPGGSRSGRRGKAVMKKSSRKTKHGCKLCPKQFSLLQSRLQLLKSAACQVKHQMTWIALMRDQFVTNPIASTKMTNLQRTAIQTKYASMMSQLGHQINTLQWRINRIVKYIKSHHCPIK